MLKLISYELGKLLRKRVLLFALLFFVILDVINIVNTFGMHDFEHYHIPQELQRSVPDDMIMPSSSTEYRDYASLTDNQKQEISIRHALFSAYNLQQQQVEEQQSLKNTLDQWDPEDTSSFDYRNQLKRSRMINELPSPYVFIEHNATPVVSYINLYGMIYVSIMIILGISTMFTSEYASSMDKIIKSSVKGKKQLVTAKILASFTYATMVALFFTLLNTLPFIGMLFDYGLNVPIQNMYPFTTSPYLLTIGQYLIMQLCIHLLGATLLTMVVLLISAMSRSILTSIFVSGVIWAFPLVIEQYTYLSGIPRFLDYALNNIIRVEPLFRTYKTMNLFGYPVLYPYVLVSIYLLLLPLIIYSIYQAFRRKQIQ